MTAVYRLGAMLANKTRVLNRLSSEIVQTVQDLEDRLPEAKNGSRLAMERAINSLGKAYQDVVLAKQSISGEF